MTQKWHYHQMLLTWVFVCWLENVVIDPEGKDQERLYAREYHKDIAVVHHLVRWSLSAGLRQ
eukprot:SAG11_NODE_4081_length_2074_cov_1.515949_1_plen_62_part_00